MKKFDVFAELRRVSRGCLGCAHGLHKGRCLGLDRWGEPCECERGIMRTVSGGAHASRRAAKNSYATKRERSAEKPRVTRPRLPAEGKPKKQANGRPDFRRPADFCAPCLAGACAHRGPCFELVAPEPRDYFCKCGDVPARIEIKTFNPTLRRAR